MPTRQRVARIVFGVIAIATSAVAVPVWAQGYQSLLTRRAALVSADWRGDRLVTATADDIEWHAMAGERVGAALGRYASGSEARILRVDLVDLTGDGRPETLVTRLHANAVDSVILTEESAKWRPLAQNLRWYFRVEGDQLYGQRRGHYTPYLGPITELTWQRGELRAQHPLSLPRTATLYNFRRLSEDDVVLVRGSGDVERWGREGRRWRLHDRLPRAITALSAQVVDAPPQLLGGDFAPAVPVPLPPWPVASDWVVVHQRPHLASRVIGRETYWEGWNVARVAAFERGAALGQPLPFQPSLRTGAVMDARQVGARTWLLVVQGGRGGPFEVPEASTLFLIDSPE